MAAEGSLRRSTALTRGWSGRERARARRRPARKVAGQSCEARRRPCPPPPKTGGRGGARRR
eukprot:7166234-Prymnesium_polylepis.1